MFAKLVQQINANPISLTPQQESELYSRYVGGDDSAGCQLIEAHLRLALVLGIEYAKKGGSVEELFNEGVLGLYEALKRFNPTKGSRFASWATWWVRSQLQDFLRGTSRQVPLPSHIIEQLTKLSSTTQVLQQKQQSQPTPAEIGQEMNLSEARILRLQSYISPSISLNQSLFDTEIDNDLSQIIEDVHTEHALDYAKRLDDIVRIKEILPKLKQQERDVLIHRFGLQGEPEQTLQQTGKLMGLSTARVQQVEKATIEKLKSLMALS